MCGDGRGGAGLREQDGRCRDQSPRWSGNGWSTLPRARRDKAARMLPTEPLIGTFNRNSYDAHIIPQSAAASFVYVTPSVRKPHPGPDAAWPSCATLPGGLAASYTRACLHTCAPAAGRAATPRAARSHMYPTCCATPSVIACEYSAASPPHPALPAARDERVTPFGAGCCCSRPAASIYS